MAKYHIEDVLPHRQPMILIDAIDQYDSTGCRCRAVISTKSMFFDHKKLGVPSYIGCEYMAQAIAAFAGANALDKNEPVNIGFLLGSRKYKTYQPYFALNSQITIQVEQLYLEESGLSVFECEIYDQHKTLLANANINVFQPSDAEDFLKENYE